MLYALKIATRYLTASKAQTALLVFGVGIGVFIFIFMSALIGGLAEFILARTAGDMSHITIVAEAVDPPQLTALNGTVLMVSQSGIQAQSLTDAAAFLPLIAALPQAGEAVSHKRVATQTTQQNYSFRSPRVAF